MVAKYPGISIKKDGNFITKKIILTRNLKDWCWQLHNNKTVVLLNKNNGIFMTLDKVRLMSFIKFAISALDKMRIEEAKQFRARIKKMRENYQVKIKKMRESYKEKVNKQRISAKARKEKK